MFSFYGYSFLKLMHFPCMYWKKQNYVYNHFLFSVSFIFTYTWKVSATLSSCSSHAFTIIQCNTARRMMFNLGKEGRSPASKASLNCLTAFSWPGSRKMPSSFSPWSLMNATHFCTRIGTMWGPKRFSYVTVSIRLFPNTAMREKETF